MLLTDLLNKRASKNSLDKQIHYLRRPLVFSFINSFSVGELSFMCIVHISGSLDFK